MITSLEEATMRSGNLLCKCPGIAAAIAAAILESCPCPVGISSWLQLNIR
ncbi:hypothetical protein [Nostoc sp.]